MPLPTCRYGLLNALTAIYGLPAGFLIIVIAFVGSNIAIHDAFYESGQLGCEVVVVFWGSFAFLLTNVDGIHNEQCECSLPFSTLDMVLILHHVCSKSFHSPRNLLIADGLVRCGLLYDSVWPSLRHPCNDDWRPALHHCR